MKNLLVLALFIVFFTGIAAVAQVEPIERCGFDNGDAIGQVRCADGEPSPIATDVLCCDCSVPTDFGTRRCALCPGANSTYFDHTTRAFCEAGHGGDDIGIWFWETTAKINNWWQGYDAPLTGGFTVGNDRVTCECIAGGLKSACLNAANATQDICFDVCGLASGSLPHPTATGFEVEIGSCLTAPTDRGPEVHCTCGGIPDLVTYCVALSEADTFCQELGGDCTVHHTAPVSTRCIDPLPAPECPVGGDANGDGLINIVDALCTAWCGVGIRQPPCLNIPIGACSQ